MVGFEDFRRLVMEFADAQLNRVVDLDQLIDCDRIHGAASLSEGVYVVSLSSFMSISGVPASSLKRLRALVSVYPFL